MTEKKIYRYRVSPERWNEFIEIQKKAHTLYKKHISYEVVYIQSYESFGYITEIQTYPDRETAMMADRLINLEPELKILFDKFFSLLVLGDNKIIEESGFVVLKL
jgi:hypothetical protein